MLRILIADDHEIIRKGLRQILLEAFSFAHIEEAGDGNTLLEKALSGDWNIIISDIAMPGPNGIEALKIIKQQFPRLPVLILSIHPEEQYTRRVLRCGASGYLSKDAATRELVIAVQRILQGRKYIAPTIVDKFIDDQDNAGKALHELLSNREFDVFKMLVTGKSVTDIAETLSLGITTVSTYRSRVLEKMNMKSNAELTRYAIENKLL
jgi:two-component system, NarL family, invasion response regulator UvrY